MNETITYYNTKECNGVKILTQLDRIFQGESIKKFTITELNILAKEIRSFLISKVAEHGGHLASNLGVVELTIALHYVFDFPQDKVVWDVGHQSYTHKILSGRMKDFDTLRKFDGISGFPKTSESPYDSFNTGHASTSISAALGMAKARDLKKETNHIMAVIGDGSLGGGLAFEGINDVGNSKIKMLIILNDNKMSISENVGAMSKYLNSIRTSHSYFDLKEKIASSLLKSDHKKLFSFIQKIKDRLKKSMLTNTLFVDLGLTYFGPFDGHDIGQLIKTLKRIKDIDKGVIMHIRTIKGKGYAPAEDKPEKYHGVPAFKKLMEDEKRSPLDYSAVFGKTLIDIAKNNHNVVAITAAMPHGTGLNDFSKEFPKRFFDVGIAEAHATTTAAGMAMNSIIPVVSIYSSFMQRAYDSVLHDICLQNLHVVMCIDRAGIVGADGETHQGIFDISYMRSMPNISIFAPSDYQSLREMLFFAVENSKGPTVIRYPRGGENQKIAFPHSFISGKAQVLKNGTDICIIACGDMVNTALEVEEILSERGISTTVIDIQSIVPLDEDTICNMAKNSKCTLTLENNVKQGGFGESVLEVLVRNKIHIPILIKAFEKGIIEQGSVDELLKKYRLDTNSVFEDAEKFYRGIINE